jgi:hypothetical protein
VIIQPLHVSLHINIDKKCIAKTSNPALKYRHENKMACFKFLGCISVIKLNMYHSNVKSRICLY